MQNIQEHRIVSKKTLRNTSNRIGINLTSVQSNSGKPKICQLYVALIRNEHIVWLQIPEDMNIVAVSKKTTTQHYGSHPTKTT